MKSWLKYLLFLISVVIGLLYLFDFIYTQSYYSETIRSKIAWVKSDQFPDSLDYVLLGSSRCINHLQPDLIEDETGQIGLNLGYAACGPVEMKIMLHEIAKKSKVRRAFIQVDQKYNDTLPDGLAMVSLLPYIKENDIYNELKNYSTKMSHYKYIPFYRYQINDPKIGFRNVLLTLLGENAAFLSEKGFVPVFRVMTSEEEFEYDFKKIENPLFLEMIQISRANNIEIHFFTAPNYNNRVDFEYLEKVLNSYTDFSHSIKDRELFADATHLNNEGSEVFTRLFIKNYFKIQNGSVTSLITP